MVFWAQITTVGGDIIIDGFNLEIKHKGGRIGSLQNGFVGVANFESKISAYFNEFKNAFIEYIKKQNDLINHLSDKKFNIIIKKITDLYNDIFFKDGKLSFTLSYRSLDSLDILLYKFLKETDKIFSIFDNSFSIGIISNIILEIYFKMFILHLAPSCDINEKYFAAIKKYSIFNDKNLNLRQCDRLFVKENAKKLDITLLLLDLFYYQRIEQFDGILFVNDCGDAYFINFNLVTIEDLDKLRDDLYYNKIFNIIKLSILKSARSSRSALGC